MNFTHIIFAFDDTVDQQRGYILLNDHMDVRSATGGYVMDNGELIEEPSYIVPFADEAWNYVRTLGRGQESVLLLSEMHAKPELRKATLRYMDVNKADVDLGWMQEAPAGMSKRELATQYGGYTEVLSRNDQYRTFVASHTRF